MNDTWLQQPQNLIEDSEQTIHNSEEDNHSSGNRTEDDQLTNRPTGNLDTCLESIDFREFNQVLSVAPGEKKISYWIISKYSF